jgi:hypothetical protein
MMKIKGKPSKLCNLQAIEMLKKIGNVLESSGVGSTILDLDPYDTALVLEINDIGEGVAGYNEFCKTNHIWVGEGGGPEHRISNDPIKILKIAQKIIQNRSQNM